MKSIKKTKKNKRKKLTFPTQIAGVRVRFAIVCMLRFKLVPRLYSCVTNYYESQIVFMSSQTIHTDYY